MEVGTSSLDADVLDDAWETVALVVGMSAVLDVCGEGLEPTLAVTTVSVDSNVVSIADIEVLSVSGTLSVPLTIDVIVDWFVSSVEVAFNKFVVAGLVDALSSADSVVVAVAIRVKSGEDSGNTLDEGGPAVVSTALVDSVAICDVVTRTGVSVVEDELGPILASSVCVLAVVAAPETEVADVRCALVCAVVIADDDCVEKSSFVDVDIVACWVKF